MIDDMKDKKTLEELLDKYWDDQGMCASCSWHACVWEHDPDWSDWNEAAGRFEFSCQNDDDEYSWDHRGVRLYVSKEDQEKYGLQTVSKPSEEMCECGECLGRWPCSDRCIRCKPPESK